MAKLEAENYYEEGCPKQVIPLDARLSPQENAAKYFKRYNKAKTAEKMLAQLMAQDLLGLGSESRMNTPSTMGTNWQWRSLPGAFDDQLAQKLYRSMVRYGRIKE